MTQAIEVVIFRLHDEEFGVEIAYIREITGVMDMTVINDPEGFIRGVVNLRGQVIVVVNWAGQFCCTPMAEMPKTARIIFIELRKRVFGFVVDQVFDVVKVPADGKSMVILDIEKVFSKFI